MEENPVEHGALRVTGTVNSCHSRRSFIKKRANPLRKGLLAEMTEVRQAVCLDRRPYLLTTVDAQDRDPQLLIQPQLVSKCFNNKHNATVLHPDSWNRAENLAGGLESFHYIRAIQVENCQRRGSVR